MSASLVGSEMCIRDRPGRAASEGPGNPRQDVHKASRRRMEELMEEDAARAAVAVAEGRDPAQLDGGHE
eukprot:9062534-Alexandrium_andersonii.AAC.1